MKGKKCLEEKPEAGAEEKNRERGTGTQAGVEVIECRLPPSPPGGVKDSQRPAVLGRGGRGIHCQQRPLSGMDTPVKQEYSEKPGKQAAQETNTRRLLTASCPLVSYPLSTFHLPPSFPVA